jgi:bacillithiol system protein YtxJ
MDKWVEIKDIPFLNKVLEQSSETNLNGILLYKHSTRCPISVMAKMRLEAGWDFPDDVPTYIVNVVENREVSNKIEKITGVKHESPQLLLLKNKEVLYHVSHGAIQVNQLKKVLNK